LSFSYFFNVFSFGANKEDLLHVTHCIISLLPFDQNSFISRLFQHVMSLTYEHVLSNAASYEYYISIVQKIVNKGANVNAKDENGKMSFALTYMWKQS
jgi:hypothetical protein